MFGIVPKEETKKTGGLKALLFLAVFLLILSLVLYFWVSSSLKKASEEIAKLELAHNDLMSAEKISLEKEVLNYKNKIEDFSFLVEQHLEISGIFEVIQETAHPKVWFTKFDFNSAQNELKISGETENFEALGQQIIILRSEAGISKVNLNKTSITKEGKIF